MCINLPNRKLPFKYNPGEQCAAPLASLSSHSLVLSLHLSLSDRPPSPAPPPPPTPRRRADVYPRASPLIGYPGSDWQVSPALLRGARALLPAVSDWLIFNCSPNKTGSTSLVVNSGEVLVHKQGEGVNKRYLYRTSLNMMIFISHCKHVRDKTSSHD